MGFVRYVRYQCPLRVCFAKTSSGRKLDFLIPLNERHLRGILKETGAARIPAWGQAYLNHHKAFRCWKFQVTEFRVANEL